jgi:hypothetical protein
MSHPNLFDQLIETTRPAARVSSPCRTHKVSQKEMRVYSPPVEQIKAILADHFQAIGQSLEKRVMADRVKRMVNIYADLSTCGSTFTDVTTFGLRHAKVLLAKWKAQGLSKKTIYNRWVTLRGWSVVLNKYGMLGTIEEVWPEFRQGEPAKPATCLTAEQIQIRSAYLRAKPDRTAYLVDRLSREVNMTRDHALQLDLAEVLHVAKGQPFVRVGKGANTRTYPMVLESWEVFSEAAQFMKERNREKLGWPHVEGTQAIAKFAQRMAYVTRTLFPDDDKSGAAGVAGPGGDA